MASIFGGLPDAQTIAAALGPVITAAISEADAGGKDIVDHLPTVLAPLIHEAIQGAQNAAKSETDQLSGLLTAAIGQLQAIAYLLDGATLTLKLPPKA